MINIYPVHENETGLFQELARTNDIKFGQLSYLVIRPNCTRGSHYHKRKEEWFCCLHGKCKFELTHTQINKTRSIILEDERREFIKIDPLWNHSITNLSDTDDCELIIIISEEYHKEDADTFRLDE